MSNGLYSLGLLLASAKGPTSLPSELSDEPLLLSVGVVGLVALVIWIIRRACYPRKLALKNTPGRPNELNPLHLVAGILVWLLLPAMVQSPLPPGTESLLPAAVLSVLPGAYPPQSPQRLTLTYLLASPLQIACLLVIIKPAFRHGLGRGVGLSLRHWKWDLLRGLYSFLAVLPVCMALAAVFSEWLKTGKEGIHEMLKAMVSLGPGWKVMIFLATAMLVPVVEELLFRGLMQSMVRRYTRSPWFAILCTSVIFALGHVPYWHTMPALLVLSVVLGYNYERTGRLAGPIVIHVCFNAINLLAVAL